MSIDLRQLKVRELLTLSASAVEELRVRGVVRTSNYPVGDYTEWLVASAMNLKLAINSASGHDAVGDDGLRYQIKGRRITSRNTSRQLSAIRNLPACDFDFLVAVVFNAQFELVEAVVIPHEAVSTHAVFRSRVNAHILQASPRLLGDPRVRCIRSTLSTFHNPSEQVST